MSVHGVSHTVAADSQHSRLCWWPCTGRRTAICRVERGGASGGLGNGPLIERTGESTEQHQQQRERQEAATEVIVWECTEAEAGGQDGTARSVAALGEQLNVAPINQ